MRTVNIPNAPPAAKITSHAMLEFMRPSVTAIGRMLEHCVRRLHMDGQAVSHVLLGGPYAMSAFLVNEIRQVVRDLCSVNGGEIELVADGEPQDTRLLGAISHACSMQNPA
ncbi:unnamed protein product [Parascedosporium putredinis]|uniref:Uncharacterized protein n=1 Tax=Parascedosporium putredinis TaxID=1442378 RepID=A0A9P1H937_9PEZI|nr:unnamed protein product [Parascedosporium putredinis]CAI8001434.1 unnamed protein product [Parascedosporium putredinis]